MITKRINFKSALKNGASRLAYALAVTLMLPTAALASSTAAPAAPAAPSAMNPQFGWEDRNQYQDCDQECLISKSKETLLIEAKYVRKLSDELNQDPSRTARTLGSFCGSGEASAKCVERYTYLLKRRMEVVQGMVAHNSDQLLKLHSQEAEIRTQDKKFHIKGTANFERYDMKRAYGKAESGKKTHAYESENTDDSLRKFGRAYESPEELQAFLEESWREPKLEDYPKITTVARNPSESNGETIMVIERNADGSIKYDEDKFNREKTVFLSVKDRLKQEMTAFGQRRAQELEQAAAVGVADPTTAAKAEERKSYDEAKGVLERTIASKGKPTPGVQTSYFIEADKSVFDNDIQALEQKLTTIMSSVVRH